MKILGIIKDKTTKETIGYLVEDKGKQYEVSVTNINEVFTTSEVDNAVLVNNKYVRGKNTKLPIIYGKKTVKMSTGFRDFADLRMDNNVSLHGVNDKIVVIDKDKTRYMLKFPKEKLGIIVYDHITEYLGCKIARALGYPVQDVQLGYYNGVECVAIKMFESIPITYSGLGSSTLQGEEYIYDLEWLLSLNLSNKFSINTELFYDWVLNVFILDMLLCNFDRHENNWGFLKIKTKGRKYKYELSPLYDFGASLFPRHMYYDNTKKTDNEIYTEYIKQAKSSIRYRGQKLTYLELLTKFNNPQDLKKRMINLTNKLDKLNFNPLFEHVVRYNKNYTKHLLFLDRLLKINYNVIKEYITDGR